MGLNRVFICVPKNLWIFCFKFEKIVCIYYIFLQKGSERKNTNPWEAPRTIITMNNTHVCAGSIVFFKETAKDCEIVAKALAPDHHHHHRRPAENGTHPFIPQGHTASGQTRRVGKTWRSGELFSTLCVCWLVVVFLLVSENGKSNYRRSYGHHVANENEGWRRGNISPRGIWTERGHAEGRKLRALPLIWEPRDERWIKLY